MTDENAVCFSIIDQPESWKIQTYMSSGGYLTWKQILQGHNAPKARVGDVGVGQGEFLELR